MGFTRGGEFLYRLTATDYATLTVGLAGIALSAAWSPTRRAALVESHDRV